jgi:hypothetical protein
MHTTGPHTGLVSLAEADQRQPTARPPAYEQVGAGTSELPSLRKLKAYPL